MFKDYNRGMCRWSGIGEGEVADEVIDVIGGQIYRALKATLRTLAFSPIYISGVIRVPLFFLTFSIMNYNILEKNSKNKNVHLNNITK